MKPVTERLIHLGHDVGAASDGSCPWVHPPSRDRLRQSPGVNRVPVIRSSILRLSLHRNQDWLITEDVRQPVTRSRRGRLPEGGWRATLVSRRLDTPHQPASRWWPPKRERVGRPVGRVRRCRRRARPRPGAVRVDLPRSRGSVPMTRPPANWRVAVCSPCGCTNWPRPRWRRFSGRRTQWWSPPEWGQHIHQGGRIGFGGNGSSRVGASRWDRPAGCAHGCSIPGGTEFLQTRTAVRLSLEVFGRRGLFVVVGSLAITPKRQAPRPVCSATRPSIEPWPRFLLRGSPADEVIGWPDAALERLAEHGRPDD